MMYYTGYGSDNGSGYDNSYESGSYNDSDNEGHDSDSNYVENNVVDYGGSGISDTDENDDKKIKIRLNFLSLYDILLTSINNDISKPICNINVNNKIFKPMENIIKSIC